MSSSFARRRARDLEPACAPHVDLVVVRRVQRRRGRRGHPGAVRAGLRVADLLLEHRGHQVGIAHMPLPICARPGSPQARPMSTFQSS
jgi:hypothetical protein